MPRNSDDRSTGGELRGSDYGYLFSRCVTLRQLAFDAGLRMPMRYTLFLSALTVCTIAGHASADLGQPATGAPAGVPEHRAKTISAVFTATPPRLDGKLDDAVWQAAAALPTCTALGFVNRTGIREYEVEIGYNWRPEGRWLRSITSSLEAWRVERMSGELESGELKFSVLQLENQTADNLVLDYRSSRELLLEPFEISAGVVIRPGDYSFDSYCMEASSGQHRALAGTLFACDGDFYDGNRLSTGTQLTWCPNRHLRPGAGFEWNDIALPYGAFITRLANLRADIAFTATWYWENFFQYDNVSETLGVNSILRWVPDAGNEVVLVLNRQLEDFDRDNRFDSLYTEMTFKLAYTLRF